MLYLNTRHRLPQISIHQNWSNLNRSAVVQPQTHGSNEQAQSNKGATQPRTEIENYPSRRAYGSRTMTDYTRERGQKGIADAQAATSERAQRAWAFIEQGARRGNDIPQKYKSVMMSKYSTAKNLVNFELMSGPNISVSRGQVVGEPYRGDVTAEVDTQSTAEFEYTPGSAETTLEDRGFIRNWVSDGHYDIYA